jgi:hypothetical protein
VHEHHIRHRQVQIRLRQGQRRAPGVDAEIDIVGGLRLRIAQRRGHQLTRPLDHMGTRLDRHALVVEEAHRPFEAGAVGAVGEADQRSARHARDPRGLDEPLAVDHEIVILSRERAAKRADLAPVVDRENAFAPASQRHGNRPPHAADELHKPHEAFLDEPVDLGLGMAASNIGDHRHVVNDVAQ